ncbi:MAG: hypothetical protein ACLUOI_24555 [Eisenbergiella sp.]
MLKMYWTGAYPISSLFCYKKRGNASSSEISENIGIKSCFLRRDLTEQEKETAREWVDAMADNLYCEVKQVAFCGNPEEAGGLV